MLVKVIVFIYNFSRCFRAKKAQYVAQPPTRRTSVETEESSGSDDNDDANTLPTRRQAHNETRRKNVRKNTLFVLAGRKKHNNVHK